MALPVTPFTAPLFITKRRNQPNRPKNLGKGGAVTYRGFSLDPMLVPILSRPLVGQSLVRYSPFAAVASNAQDLRSRPHLAIRRVVEHVTLECPWRVEMKPSGFQPSGECRNVIHTEFDLGFHACHNQRVYASSSGCPLLNIDQMN